MGISGKSTVSNRGKVDKLGQQKESGQAETIPVLYKRGKRLCGKVERSIENGGH